jgi:hypothetical protein
MGPKGELLPVLMSQVSDIWLGRESSSKVLKAEHPTSNIQRSTSNFELRYAFGGQLYTQLSSFVSKPANK